MVERLVSAKTRQNEEEVEQTLRPRHLSEYIGQERMKERLQIMIEASKGRGDVLDHLLFYGPPGLGKTTISMVLANEMGVPIRHTSGPDVESPGDLAYVQSHLKVPELHFIDGIPRLINSTEA